MMVETWTLQFRCARVGRAVDAPAADEVVLLRAARTLKSLHTHLACALLEQQREGVQPPWRVLQASNSLDLMERDLREILLRYGEFRTRELHDRVRAAFDHCLEIVDVLESASVDALPAAITA